MIRLRLPALLLATAALMACGPEKSEDTGGSILGKRWSDTDDTDDTDDTGPLTHESDFALIDDDASIYARVSSAASVHLDVHLTTGVAGFATYTETDSEGSETCSAVLSINTAEDSVECDGCDWSVGARTDLAVQSGSCVLASAETALDQARGLSAGGFGVQLNHYTDATVGGSEYPEALTLGTFDAISLTLDEAVVYGEGDVGSYDSLSGALTGDLSSIDDYTLGWLECGSVAEGNPGNLTPGELSLSEDLACGVPDDFGTHTVDHWSRQLAFGQIVSVGVRSQSSDVDLFLKAPSGCLLLESRPAEPCLDDSTTWCKSFEYTVTTGGDYTALVALTGCSADVNYQFDARVR